jgi:hypothetical protein
MSDTPTAPGEWKKSSGINVAVPLEVPSGNTALVRTPGAQQFLKLGMVPNSLVSIMEKSAVKGEEPAIDELSSILKNPKELQDLFAFIDAVVIYCCVEPKVEPEPEATFIRDENVLYVDEVDMDDKMFIFQFSVGGTKDLERFRQQSEANMESLSARQDVELPS